MTLSTVTLGGTRLEPGQLDCNELYGDASLMEDQLMFFGNQDDATGVMQLPDRTVADFPLLQLGGDPDAVCDFAAGLGLDCVDCPDGNPWCLEIEARFDDADWIEGLDLREIR